MCELIREEARDIPVFDKVDVLVAGGGLSGFAAALSAARAGAKVILVERNGCLGGVATASMMGNIGNRFTISGGRQVVYGIAGEIVEALAAEGAACPNWRQHKAIAMDSERLKVILIDMLEVAGVTVLTHSMAALPIVADGAIRGCFFESKSGRLAIPAGATVDCTGEADLAFRAGAQINEHRASSSLLFKLANVDIDRFVDFLGEDPGGFPNGRDWVKDYDEFASRWRTDGVLFFPHHGGKAWRWLQGVVDRVGYGALRDDDSWGSRWWGLGHNIDAFGMYTHRHDGTLVINTGYYVFDRIEVGELSRFELHAQKLCYYAGEFLIRNVPGFEKARVEHIGVDLGLRGGRFITGRSRLMQSDFKGALEDRHCDDVIATAPVVPSAPDEKPGALGTTCDVPFGSCVPRGLSNLLVGSGKSVDAEGGNWRIYRGMSGCMVYGQATGAAAALAARTGAATEDVPVRDIQQELVRQGVRLGDEGRLAELGLSGKAG